jgi:hypothetical protein
MDGKTVNYLYYKDGDKRSIITIPRAILEAENMNWDHKTEINIVVKVIDGQKGLFLFKKEENSEKQ